MRKRRPVRRYSLRRLSGTRSWSVTTIGHGERSSAPSIQGEWKTSTRRGRCASTISLAAGGGLAQRGEQAGHIAPDAAGVGRAAVVVGHLHAATVPSAAGAIRRSTASACWSVENRAAAARAASPIGACAGEHIERRRGERVRVAGSDEPAGDAVLDHLGQPADPGGHHGVPTAIASASTVPNGSWREGRTSTSRWRMTPGALSTQP